MAEILLISKSDFPAYVDLPSTQIEDRYVNPYILRAQVEVLRAALCKDLYNEILEQFNAGSLSPENQELYDNHIKRILVMYAFSYMLPGHRIKVTTHSVVVKTAPNVSIPAETSDVIIAANEAIGVGKTFLGLMTEFLQENQDSYPLWCDGCDCDENGVSYPNGANFF